jgi:class 3 adenylate cyclase
MNRSVSPPDPDRFAAAPHLVPQQPSSPKASGSTSSVVFSVSRGTFRLHLNIERQRAANGRDVAGPPTEPGTFWDTLGATARLDFVAIAEQRTFAAGARLMEEGEPADHVAVISSGSVRITIKDNGREASLAVRGPGELIGERAALRVSERSATVVALETVKALVVKTEDFAAFVSAHPGVLHAVEGQIYRRLTERPAYEQRPVPRFEGQNCTIVYTDVVGFAAGTRNDIDRLVVRQATTEMTKAAFGSYWGACLIGDRGDGLLIVAPPDVPTMTLMKRLMTVLPAELAKHNAIHDAPVRVQLRVAVEVGPVVEDEIGVSGEGIIRAARMLAAPVFKTAIAERGSALGVIASDFVHRTAIKHGGAPLDPADYVRVRVNVKESQMEAWLWLIPQAS